MGYLRSTFACIILITVALISSCSWVTWSELYRVSSPDRKVQAVVEVNNPAGAGSHPAYRVSIVPAGQKPTNDDRVLGYDYINDAKIQWISPHLLEIQYTHARIRAFRNYWNSRRIKGFDFYAVKVRIVEKEETGTNE